jgi:hypothetical protein
VTWTWDDTFWAITEWGKTPRSDYTDVYEGTYYLRLSKALGYDGVDMIQAYHVNPLINFTNYQEGGSVTSFCTHLFTPAQINTADTYAPASMTWTQRNLIAGNYNYFNDESAINTEHSDYNMVSWLVKHTESTYQVAAYNKNEFFVESEKLTFLTGVKAGFVAHTVRLAGYAQPLTCPIPRVVDESDIIPSY